MKAELNELEAEKEKDLKGKVSGLFKIVKYKTDVVGDQVSSAAKLADSGSVASPISFPSPLSSARSSDAAVSAMATGD